MEADGDRLTYTMKGGAIHETRAPAGYLASNQGFTSALIGRGVTFLVKPEGLTSAARYGALALGLVCLAVAGVALARITTGRVPMLERPRAVDPEQITVTVEEDVASYLNNKKRRDLVALEQENNVEVQVVSGEGLSPEYLKIDCLDANGREVKFAGE